MRKANLEPRSCPFFLLSQNGTFSLCLFGCEWLLTGLSCARFECPLKTKPCTSIGLWLNSGRTIGPTRPPYVCFSSSQCSLAAWNDVESAETRDHWLRCVVNCSYASLSPPFNKQLNEPIAAPTVAENEFIRNTCRQIVRCHFVNSLTSTSTSFWCVHRMYPYIWHMLAACAHVMPAILCVNKTGDQSWSQYT